MFLRHSPFIALCFFGVLWLNADRISAQAPEDHHSPILIAQGGPGMGSVGDGGSTAGSTGGGGTTAGTTGGGSIGGAAGPGGGGATGPGGGGGIASGGGGGGSSSAGSTSGGDSKGIPVLEYPTEGGFGYITVKGGPLGTFSYYFQLIYPWVIGVAAGIAVLWGLFGGVMIIFSADDQSKRAEGIEKFKWAIAGLLMIIFARLILHTLNPNFFL